MKWVFKDHPDIPSSFIRNIGIDPVLIRLLADRGVMDDAGIERFFQADFDKHLHDPFLFVDLPKVVDRVKTCIAQGERVGIFGDFDADGVTGSVLLREALEGLGVPVSVYIPHKSTEGHGLNMRAIEQFYAEGIRLMFTVDCGISNFEEIRSAQSLGIDVIVIDHHHIPSTLPPALVCINPQMSESGYPFRSLCGAGTAFKVAQGLYEKLAPEKKYQIKWLLDLVAIGTVADCMPLVDENRVLVKYGLIVLSKTRRVGLRELYSLARVPVDEENPPTSVTIGFHIAPRINAAGRMAHAQVAHDMLFEKNTGRAKDLATRLEQHNKNRQKLSSDITDDVRLLATKKFAEKKFIFAVSEHFSVGVVGLVAGRIASEFNKPTAVLQRGEVFSQGSFRSIPGLNIIETIEKCGDMLEKFGGHAQAAGMTIANDRCDAFYERFNALVEEALADRHLEPEIMIDDCLFPHHLDFTFLSFLKRFEPFGEGNREPIFAFRDVTVVNAKTVGADGKHLKAVFAIEHENKRVHVDAIGFGLGAKIFDLPSGTKVDIVGSLDENEWNGRKSIQIKLCDIRSRHSK